MRGLALVVIRVSPAGRLRPDRRLPGIDSSSARAWRLPAGAGGGRWGTRRYRSAAHPCAASLSLSMRRSPSRRAPGPPAVTPCTVSRIQQCELAQKIRAGRGYNGRAPGQVERGCPLSFVSKSALIVDDSRTARQALGAVLAANRLRVETAASAEEALEYLSHSRPDVIFMDHQMPGMDGLQAVKAIKTNPATATIPIMMYTSQGGELYVGQARALGALGVLPKQIKPVEVSDLLKSLHLVEAAATEPAAAAEAPAPEAPAAAAAIPADPRGDLELWVQSLLAHQSQEIRADVQAAVARALREHEVARAAVGAGPLPPARRRAGPLLLVLLALAAVAATFFLLNLDTQRKWRSAVQQNASLVDALNERRSASAAAVDDSTLKVAAARDAAAGRYADFIAALEWSVNQAAQFPPGGEPFAGQRLEILRGLVDRLATLGFTGTLRLDGHVGDFCYVSGADGALQLAPDELPAERCARIGLGQDEARAASGRQSIAFANYLAGRAADPALRIEVVPHGSAQPAVPYPALLAGLTAGEWNAVARQNNRVNITLLPAVPQR
ncbi:MAG: response regulator [Gammaproteobacteria bacterium PRO8]|nr:response regulator [Gammaproteobacteria bacterium PRO8]